MGATSVQVQHVQVQRVTGTPHFAAWLDLRRDLYLDAGFIDGSDLRDGQFTDRYDARAHHVLLSVEGIPVGCARLILRGDDEPLQVEEHLGLSVPSSAAEFSAFAVRKEQRTTDASLRLIHAVVVLGTWEGVEWVVAEIEPWLLRALQCAGFPMEAVSEPVFVYNTWNVAAWVNLPAFVAGVQERIRSGSTHPFDRIFRDEAAADLLPDERVMSRV